jgi:sporulation-control protein spo0M
MGFLDTLKQVFNIGGVQVQIAADHDIHSQEDAVSGQVVLRGGQYARSGNEILLELKEFWTETRSTGKSTTTVTVYRQQQTVPLCGPFTIGAGEERAFRFVVQLPQNCRISTSATGWCIDVRLDIPSAIDPSGRVTLKVIPAETMLALVAACQERLQFAEVQERRRWDAKRAVTRLHLLPPDILRSELDYLALELRQTDDGGVAGELVFDLQEKSVSDYFRAIFNLDQVRRPIALTREQLLLDSGEPNLDACAPVLADALREVIQSRRHPLA